ncbi:hypothetical protein DM02DRAFT_7666 [Periconia macrospinosa]|uniref:DUF7053 domain-containing protein n=1 Tax=Periconia macrospinosa TaxID=97972 RepID=A0A2V1EEY1_9PLEO|nr:hypothetical protein DM02DRAFT_7666 [Periconia macrospinosa]
MSRTSVFTSITPLPSGITRQSVLDAYHNHVEMIELNPLVVERFQCKPPSYAPEEEIHSTWYTIKDKVSYLPGGLAAGSVSYHACFHDLTEGLQTHVYAPLGLDIHAKWTVGGSLPGEPKAAVELGLKAPASGLYIREDVRMKCNIMMMGFVKKTFKDSHAKLVDRLVEKAHIMESEAANRRLQMLKNLAPGERSGHGDIFIAPPPGYQDEPQEQQKHQHQDHLYDRPDTNNNNPPPQYLPAQTFSSLQSLYSDGSSQSPVHSPGSSINTGSHSGGSSYLTSPPYSSTSSQRHSHHGHSHSQDCNQHMRLDPEHHHPPPHGPLPPPPQDIRHISEQEKLEQQIAYLLPPTRYEPRASPPTTTTNTTPVPTVETLLSKPLNPLQQNPPTPPKYSLLPAVAYDPSLPQRSKSQNRGRAWTEGSVMMHAIHRIPPSAPPTIDLPGPPVPPKNHVITELPA